MEEHDIYIFEFTTAEVEVIKSALLCSGVEFCCNRDIYKKLCEAVCDESDKNLLARYE